MQQYQEYIFMVLQGDIAAEEACYESIIASDIIKSLGKAFNKIRDKG